MANHSLDGMQTLKEAYDASTGAFRTTPSDATSFQIELSAADGDSAILHRYQDVLQATLAPAASGLIIPVTESTGLQRYQLYAQPLAALSGAASIRLDVSPVDSGDVWFSTSLTLSSGTSSGVVAASAISDHLARRVRVTITAAPVGGSVLVMLSRAS